MLYLVQFEYVEPGPMYAPRDVVNMVEKTIVPSLEAVVRYQKEGKIQAAGVIAGSKSSAMIVDVADNDELSTLVQSLPFWSIMKVHITPLQSFAAREQQEKGAVAFLKSADAEPLLEAW
jgi:muconolactone delta-isomerase